MRRVFFLALLAIVAGMLSTPLPAQTLEAGSWFGSMQPPETPEPFRIDYEVSYDGDVMRIVALGGDNSLVLNEARFENGNLVYWFQPGPRVDCVLEPDGKDTYAGDCSDTDGGTGQMMITRDESRVAGLKSVEEMEGGGGGANH
ncbi:MAG TPA: hypothetical protein VK845_06985 [Gemmatimonadales bacterium]|nr:hypothetical protein [Gemmatimonadales bacterium]